MSEELKTLEEFKKTNASAETIMKQFDTAESLNKLLQQLQPMFDKLEYDGYLLRKGQVVTNAVINSVMDYATGASTFLNKIWGIAQHEYKTQAARFLLKAKAAEGKSTDKACEAQGLVDSNLWRRAAGLLQGYYEASKNHISVCQTKLKHFTDEKPRKDDDAIVG
jgi:hypothetical protein